MRRRCVKKRRPRPKAGPANRGNTTQISQLESIKQHLRVGSGVPLPFNVRRMFPDHPHDPFVAAPAGGSGSSV